MARQIRVRTVKRKEIDEDKLAMAFLLLAKSLHQQREAVDDGSLKPDRDRGDQEAA